MFAARQGFFTQPSGGFGNNLYFPNNGSQFLSKAGTTNLVTWKATTGFTIEYWVYSGTFSTSINPGPGNQDGAGTNYWSFGPISGGAIEFYYWAPGTTYVTTATGIMTANTWYNICMVCTTTGSSTTISIYLNGVRQNIKVGSGSYAATQTVTNGTVSAGTVFGMGKYGGSVWNCYMDNLRVSNINRYSGSSYTLATDPFTSDSNTQILITPTASSGTTIPYQSTAGNGNMTNASNIVSIVATHANHS